MFFLVAGKARPAAQAQPFFPCGNIYSLEIRKPVCKARDLIAMRIPKPNYAKEKGWFFL